MDTFMDKLAQKMNAQEIIKANMAAETARMEQLQSQVEAYEALLKDMRRVNTKTVENTEQMKKVLQESLSKIEEVQTARDEEADIKQMLAELKQQMEEAFRRSDDFMHKENVKVYRNVQAAMIEELYRLSDALGGDTGAWVDAYRRGCVNLGKRVQLLWTDHRTEAEAVDIDEQFGLVVRLDDGRLTTVRTGEVSVRGLYGYAE